MPSTACRTGCPFAYVRRQPGGARRPLDVSSVAAAGWGYSRRTLAEDGASTSCPFLPFVADVWRSFVRFRAACARCRRADRLQRSVFRWQLFARRGVGPETPVGRVAKAPALGEALWKGLDCQRTGRRLALGCRLDGPGPAAFWRVFVYTYGQERVQQEIFIQNFGSGSV